jgi:hypothetical protein
VGGALGQRHPPPSVEGRDPEAPPGRNGGAGDGGPLEEERQRIAVKRAKETPPPGLGGQDGGANGHMRPLFKDIIARLSRAVRPHTSLSMAVHPPSKGKLNVREMR